jgi:hypothetical protein
VCACRSSGVGRNLLQLVSQPFLGVPEIEGLLHAEPEAGATP